MSNSSYARIADNGDGTATITGLRAGTIKIAAIATDGSDTREEMTIRVIVPVTSYRLYPNETTLAVGDTISLKPDGEPANATYHKPSDFTWKSDNESVATVSDSGVVTAVGEGACHHHRHFPQRHRSQLRNQRYYGCPTHRAFLGQRRQS